MTMKYGSVFDIKIKTEVEIDTFASDVRRAAQMLVYIPEGDVVATLSRSMPADMAFLITKAAYILLADELGRVLKDWA